MATLVRRVGGIAFGPVALSGAVAMATAWYWSRFTDDPAAFRSNYLPAVAVLSTLAAFAYQAWRYGTKGVIVNCSATLFCVLYIGLLGGFVPAVRIDFGPGALLMFVFTVKSCDIGAYTAGRLWGRHKFSPTISPGKTWEGLLGGIVLATITAVLFAALSGIMQVHLGFVFGVVFAVLGQLGDLAESMLKRDAQQKDSAQYVPGYGGVLDVMDSLLATAPVAYLFFALARA